MEHANAAAPQDQIVTGFESEWDKENAVAMFDPSDQHKKQHAWEREPRPASNQTGKNRKIWKRHDTDARKRRAKQPSAAAQPSPKKVVKKACVPSEGSVQTPKHKRLGIAKTWDRRQSDRLHKLRSLKLTSPIKVLRDSTSHQIDPSGAAPNSVALQQDIDEEEAGETPGKVTPRLADSTRESELVVQASNNKTETPILCDNVAAKTQPPCDEPLESADSTLQPNNDDGSMSNNKELFGKTEPGAEKSLDVKEMSEDEAQLLADEQASRCRLSVADSFLESKSDDRSHNSDYHSEGATENTVGSIPAREEPAQVDMPHGLSDMIVEQHTSPTHLQNVEVSQDDEDVSKVERSPLGSSQEAVGKLTTSPLKMNLPGDLDTARAQSPDETSIDSSFGSDEEADDRRVELNLGSPGTTGPIHLFGSAAQTVTNETLANDGAKQEKFEPWVADDDIFANLDEIIAQPSTHNQPTSLAIPMAPQRRQSLVKNCAEDATEVIEEIMTVTVQLNDNDDTEMLRDFLNRSRASKAARIAKRSSLNNKRDSDAVKLALASPRKPVGEEIDPTMEHPTEPDEATSNMQQPLLENLSEETTQDLGPADELSGSPQPPTSRRSTRSKESRLNPSSITIRRPDGSEPFVLKKSEAQELAIATRANTRRNKGGAVNAKLMLMRLKGLAPEALPEGEKETAIKWNEQLVMYLGEKSDVLPQEDKTMQQNHDETETASKPRVRRKRTLGAMNGTPAKPMHSEEGIASGAAPVHSLPAPKMSMPKTHSETRTERRSIPEAPHHLLPTKKRRAIPTPTSRVPKAAGKSHPVPPQPLQRGLSQDPMTDVDTAPLPNTGSSKGDNALAVAITQESPQASEPSSGTGNATTSAGGNTNASGHATTSAMAIASAAASAGRKGLSAAMMPRGVVKPARETRSALRR